MTAFKLFRGFISFKCINVWLNPLMTSLMTLIWQIFNRFVFICSWKSSLGNSVKVQVYFAYCWLGNILKTCKGYLIHDLRVDISVLLGQIIVDKVPDQEYIRAKNWSVSVKLIFSLICFGQIRTTYRTIKSRTKNYSIQLSIFHYWRGII